MKSCAYCQRTFLKTEHLLRHERSPTSDTGEKPYQCNKCHRRYARSDVLLRHAKFFHPEDKPQTHQRSQDGATKDPTEDSLTGQPSSSDGDDSDAAVDRDDIGDDEPRNQEPPATTVVPAGMPVAENVPVTTDSVVVNDLDTLAAASMLQAQNDGLGQHRQQANGVLQPPVQQQTPSIQRAVLPPGATPTAAGDPSHDMPFMVGVMAGHMGFLGDETPTQLTRFLTDSYRPNCQLDPSLMDMDLVFSGALNSHPTPSNMMHISAVNNVNHEHHQNLDYLDFMSFGADMNLPLSAMSSHVSNSDRAHSIPVERFSQVARLWPNPGGMCTTDDEATRLWADVVAYKGDNILTDLSVAGTSPASSVVGESGSPWGLDEDRRQDLIRELSHNLPTPEGGHRGFPPRRMLNLGLNVLFRQSSSLLQCIHRPSFSANSASPLVVLSSCLLGLVLLDSRHVRALAVNYLPAATQKCCHLLATPDFGPDRHGKLIANLTSALLLVQAWLICSPRCIEHETLVRMVHNQAFTVAQMSGLFAPRTSSPSVDELLQRFKAERASQGQPVDDDAMWKAWARTESVKRLVSSLIVIDVWLAYRLNNMPLLRSTSMRFEHPCSMELFQCSSARAWKRCLGSGGASSLVGDSILLHMNGEPVMDLPESNNVSTEGMLGLFSVVWNRILQARAEVSSASSRASGSHPAVLASTETGVTLSRTLGSIYTAHVRFLRFKNPNCITVWHFLNMQIFADIGVFELAAGRNGADSAHEALQAITLWSQTRHARRACLHAAAVYVAMSRRRLSDGTMFHSETSIFAAALVLGLYVFMMGPSGDAAGADDADEEEPYELLNDVDWARLSSDGHLASSSAFSPVPVPDAERAAVGESAASRFVQHGGAVSFSGVICEGGYNAAKMILLEYASLLEEVGKWDSKGACHILKIMSDSLLDVEN